MAAAAVVLMLVACADAATDGDAPSVPPSSGAASGTAPRAYTVDEAVAADVDGPILVTGLLIDDGGGWRLCAAIAESFPPQCGGTALSVDGLDAAEYDLQEAEGVRWNEGATVFGELNGETLTVTGPAASASLPGPAGT